MTEALQARRHLSHIINVTKETSVYFGTLIIWLYVPLRGLT